MSLGIAGQEVGQTEEDDSARPFPLVVLALSLGGARHSLTRSLTREKKSEDEPCSSRLSQQVRTFVARLLAGPFGSSRTRLMSELIIIV